MRDLNLPDDLAKKAVSAAVSIEIKGRRIPELTSFDELNSEFLQRKAVILPSANTLAHFNYSQRRFGRVQNADGKIRLFNGQTLLVKFRGAEHVAALRVEENRELEAVQTLSSRKDVEYAELDFFQERQFIPNDSYLTNQWHHPIIGSAGAWEKSLGRCSIRLAIIDTPFQMNHPDLVINTVSGWDVVDDQPVTASAGIIHSTLGAGMAAAVINNQIGVAGTVNCSILPININGAISEMYNAIIWAADHDVRVVNLSWTGADSPSLNDAGLYLKNKSRGVLAMAGVNGTGFLNYPDYPNIYCISMTDASDNITSSRYGDHNDFAAPGWNIFSTTTNSNYASGSGTSFSTPLFAGVVAAILSINPTLSADEAIEIVKSTAVDKGPPGRDQYYGWGRINFGASADAAYATLPQILSVSQTNNQIAVTTTWKAGLNYSLQKTASLPTTNWLSATNLTLSTNGNVVTLIDNNTWSSNAFYRVEVQLP